MDILKNLVAGKLLAALVLISVSTMAGANLVPGIGAQAVATTTSNITPSESCISSFQIPSASCGVSTAGASATVSTSNSTSLGDITAHAAGGGWADGIIQNTLYFQGNIPANGTAKIEMTATGTLTGTGPSASEYLWVGGFNVPGLLTPGNMIQGAVITSNLQNNCYDPGIYQQGSPYGITLCAFSDGHNIGISWEFPLSYLSAGLDFRAQLDCTASASGAACNYTDPLTITLPAGVTFTSAAGQLAPVPVPAAVWLFGSGLLGLIGFARRRRTS